MHSPQRTGSYAWMFCLLTVALLDPSAVTAQSPDDPVADAGGPYVTYEEDVEDGLWPFTFDGSGSMPGDAGDPIVNYRWDAECVSLETFDGTVIDTDAWYTSRATQDDAITITGTSSWGSGYVFSKESVFRSDDLSVEGQVTNSGGYAMWGLKHNNTNFSYTAMPYAIYFHTYGYIYIYEDGSNRGHLGYFSFGVTYDVRINVKPTSGARYYIRETGATDWTLLYDSGHSSASEFLVGISVYSSTHVMDNVGPITTFVSYGEVLDCSVSGEGEVTLTVTDSEGRSASDTTEVMIEGDSPVADADGPYGGLGGMAIQFDGTGSSDDVGIARYEWDFGDGTTGTGSQPSHTYQDIGTFEVTLTVYDQAGHAGTDTTTVEVMLRWSAFRGSSTPLLGPRFRTTPGMGNQSGLRACSSARSRLRS